MLVHAICLPHDSIRTVVALWSNYGWDVYAKYLPHDTSRTLVALWSNYG